MAPLRRNGNEGRAAAPPDSERLPTREPGPPLLRTLRGRHFGPVLIACLLVPSPAMGQYKLTAPSGAELVFSEEALRRMLDTTRALRRDLSEDPQILYFLGTGSEVTSDAPDAAFPWNAVEVLADSVATVQTPTNLREADRAYANYAVMRMKNVQSDPDVSCDSIVAREVAAVASFVDGWVVARTLFGGPQFAPLDEIAFAREAGVLPGLITQRGDRQLGGCLVIWADDHNASMAAYRVWRKESFAEGANRAADPTSTSTDRPRGRQQSYSRERFGRTAWLSGFTTP